MHRGGHPPPFTVPLRFNSLPLAAFFFSMIAVSAPGLERIVIDHAYVTGLAQKKADGLFQPSARTVPRFFREINYDTYRQITFNPQTTLWRDGGLNFQLQFYHPGYIYTQMVRLNEFSDTHAQPIPFARSFFDYHDLNVPLVSRWGLDFAGFRVLHPLNEPDRWDELISFLGASYYRALGRRQVYGASARGLAINAGGPDPEEFPAFTEFWIRKPDPGATTLTVHALLESPTVTGAYTFTVTPGAETLVETHATLFFRTNTVTAGLVPLSSMFWFGEGSANHFGDFRPEVHDSDGLLIAADAQTRLWRPLANPAGLAVTDYDAPAFAGFGLLQRDRAFRDYEDTVASYERRPGIWVEPVGPWPAGRVRLVEIPAKDEFHDNITVFWMPREAMPTGQPVELNWKQHWTFAATFGGPAGWVSATRQTLHEGGNDRTKFVIDFDAGSLASVPANANVTADVTVSGAAKITNTQVIRKEADGARRIVLVVQAPPGVAAVEVRARLVLDGQPLTETWTDRWQP